MIVFKGEVSDNARFFMKKLEARFLIIITSIVSIIFCIPVLVSCIYIDWICALFFVPLAFAVFSGVIYRFIPTDLKKIRMPTKVSIMSDIMISSGKDFEYGRYYDDVKKVVDYGEWYHMVFYFPHKIVYYVCQKDLIIEGTIEEFEALFKDKLVRKIHRS